MIKVDVLELRQLSHPLLSQSGFADLDYVGDSNLMDSPMIGIISSARCSASQILKAHDYAKEIRNGEMGIISGFHAPAEKEVLEVLLKGTCPIVVVLGRRLEGARLPVAWKTEVEKGRMLVISPFREYQKRVTKAISLKQNDLATRIAGRVLIVHASEGGSLQGQIKKWETENIRVEYLD